jgi:hypothetical protein
MAVYWQKRYTCSMHKKAITHLKLNLANGRKLAALDALATEYQRVMQSFVDGLIEAEAREPNPYAVLATVATALSARVRRGV